MGISARNQLPGTGQTNNNTAFINAIQLAPNSSSATGQAPDRHYSNRHEN